MLSQERRTPAGYPHRERERHFVNRHRNYLRRDVLDTFSEISTDIKYNPKKIRAELAKVWIDFGLNDRPTICATWIETWIESTLDPMAQAEECGIGMGLYGSFFSGVAFINDAIAIGNKEKDGEADKIFSSTYEQEGYRRSLGDVLREREYAVKCAERLKLYPSGIGMLDEFCRELSLGRWNDVFAGDDSDTVHFGARIARDLYRKVYPLSVGLGRAA